MDQSKIFKSNLIKYSVIYGIIGIVLAVIPYVSDEALISKWWYGLGIIVVFFVLYLVASFNLRTELGGFIEFKKVFFFVILLTAFSGLISTGFNLILHTVIDPDYGARIQREIVNNTIEMMEGFGAPQESIDEQVEKLESEEMFSAWKIIKGYLINTLIFGVIVGLIVGLIVKKKEPEEIAV